MTYSGNLDPTTPGQGSFARLGAAAIRALTLALQERLASVYVDPNADPLVIKPGTVNIAALKSGVVEFTWIGGGSLGAGAIITLQQANTAPNTTLVVPVWKTLTITPTQASNIILNAWHDGVNLNWTVKNTGGSTIDITGCTIRLTSLLV